MTRELQVAAVAHFGFTNRQAAFLVTVMRHSGVCLGRQYCAFAHIAHGQVTLNFFADLVTRGFATAYPCGHNRGWIYHVQHKSLYRAIGDPDTRFRKPAFLGRAVERLMLLDAVLSRPDIDWLATEREKLAHFTSRVHGRLEAQDLPALTFGTPPQTTVRYFPDKLPIGLDPGDDGHVFLYLITQMIPMDFRAFLHRHAELLRALSRWTVRLLVPRHLARAEPLHREAFRQELTTPLSSATYDELRWYFELRRAGRDARELLSTRYQRARRAFAAPRFRSLYRGWLRDGDAALNAVRSPTLADAMRRGAGCLESEILAHAYHHLLPLVGTA